MIRGALSIDQSPCRASYGLLTPSSLLTDIVQRQRSAVMANIGSIVARGDRLAKFQQPGNQIEVMAAERDDAPFTVVLKTIERPIISYQPSTGNVDISV